MDTRFLPTPEDVLIRNEMEKLLLVFSIYEDVRPLKGTAGLLDWRLRGLISRFLMSGKISGKKDEIIYFPVQFRGKPYHLLAIGMGKAPKRQISESRNEAILEQISQTIEKLQFNKIALSVSSFPFLSTMDSKEVEQHLNGTQVEYIQ